VTHRDQPASGSGRFAMVLFAPVAVVAVLVLVGTLGADQDDGALPQLVQPAQTTALVDLTTPDSMTVQPTWSQSPVTGPAVIHVSHKSEVPSGQKAATTPQQPSAPQVTSVVRVTTQAAAITTVPKTSTPRPVASATTPRVTEAHKPDCEQRSSGVTKTSQPPRRPKRR
jgi:hypothetical protein